MALKDLVRRGPAPKLKQREAPALQPIHVNDVTWFYPEKKGMLIVHEIRDRDRYIRTDQFTIKWVDVKIGMIRRKVQSEFEKPVLTKRRR